MTKSYQTFASGAGVDSRLGRLLAWLLSAATRCCAAQPAEAEPCLGATSEESLIQVLRKREDKRAEARRDSPLATPSRQTISGASTPAGERRSTASCPPGQPGPPTGGSSICSTPGRAPAAAAGIGVPFASAATQVPRDERDGRKLSLQARKAPLDAMRKKIDRKRSYCVLPYKNAGEFSGVRSPHSRLTGRPGAPSLSLVSSAAVS